MVVIHIAGSTGSGKTWIGLLMKRIYPDKKLHVEDLDHLFREAIVQSKEKDPEKQFRQIETRVRERVAGLRRAHTNLLLTGYSDVVIEGKVRYVELAADVKYFIDIPTKFLIQQYRYRASQYVAHTRHEARALSDPDLRKLVANDRKVYSSFPMVAQAQIVKEIILRLGK